MREIRFFSSKARSQEEYDELLVSKALSVTQQLSYEPLKITEEQIQLAAIRPEPSQTIDRIFADNAHNGKLDFPKALEQFERELSSVLGLLEYDENNKESENYISSLPTDELWREAENKRQINDLIKTGKVTPSQLLDFIKSTKSARIQASKVGRPKGTVPLSKNDIAIFLKIEAKIKNGLPVEVACGYEGIGRATYYRWKNKL